MYSITDLKVGVTFSYDNQPYIVLESQHSKLGRGGAILRSKIKNLLTGVIIDKTFKGNEKLEPVRIERKKAQFLYYQEEKFYFMDEESFEQFSLDSQTVGNQKNFLIEGESLQLQFVDQKAIALDLPIKMDFAVIEAEKGLKGDTATAATKPVTIETGLVVNVPIFVKKGDRIRLDTRTGGYVERAK